MVVGDSEPDLGEQLLQTGWFRLQFGSRLSFQCRTGSGGGWKAHVLESQDPNRLLYVGAGVMTDGKLEKRLLCGKWLDWPEDGVSRELAAGRRSCHMTRWVLEERGTTHSPQFGWLSRLGSGMQCRQGSRRGL
jgi:hypothetical protein